MESLLEAVCRERDEALLSLDETKIRAYMAKYDIEIDERVFWASVHKARTAARSLPMAARRFSKKLLLEQGLEPMDDGEITE